MTRKSHNTPLDWQMDPSRIETERVQIWKGNTMMGLVARGDAQQAVRDGRAFVISSQAIGNLVNGQYGE
jgi:hypothetical protein